MVSQIVTIDDILQEGKQRKIRIATGGLFLIPQVDSTSKFFLYNPLRLGVVESFGEIEKRGSVNLNPCYEVKMPENGDFTKAKIREVYGSFYLDFFPVINSGSAEEIAYALRRAPFSGMDKLANEIRKLDVPYAKSLKYLFENRGKKFAESA